MLKPRALLRARSGCLTEIFLPGYPEGFKNRSACFRRQPGDFFICAGYLEREEIEVRLRGDEARGGIGLVAPEPGGVGDFDGANHGVHAKPLRRKGQKF